MESERFSMKSEGVEIPSIPSDYDDLVPIINLRKDIEEVDENLNIFKKGSNILDIGSGTGYFTNYANKKGCKVEGMDVDAINIKKAKNLYPDIDFKEGSGLELRDEDKYDMVFCNMVICNIEGEEKLSLFLKNIHKSLKQAGNLFLSNADIKENFKEGDILKHAMLSDSSEGSPIQVSLLRADGNFTAPWKNYIWTKQKIISLLEETGFKKISFQHFSKMEDYYYIIATK